MKNFILGGEGVVPIVYGMPRNVDINDLKTWQKPSPASPADYRVINYERLGSNTGNPYWMLENDVDREKRGRFFGFANINYKFNDWLSGLVRVGADVTSVHTYNVRQPGHHYYPTGRLNNGTSRSG